MKVKKVECHKSERSQKFTRKMDTKERCKVREAWMSQMPEGH